MQAATDLFDRLTHDIAENDAYPNIDVFARHVKEEMDKLNAAN
jgi:hypothetical protein